MTTLTADIERTVARLAELDIVVEDDGSALVLTGLADSLEQKQAALELAQEMASGREVTDNIEVIGEDPSSIDGLALKSVDFDAFDGVAAEPGDSPSVEPGDFTVDRTLSNGWQASGPSPDIDEELVSDRDLLYSPPTDPVGTNREIIGGLQTDSMDDLTVERSALDGRHGDEAIADAIRRELREDAATTGLEIDVVVESGVVHLRGEVPLLDDTDNAAEVASRVQGVVEVLDELEVNSLP